MNSRNRPPHLLPLILAGTLALAMAGCASEVLPPTQHAPLTVDAVRLYQRPPAKYEALTLVSVAVTPEMQWDERRESVPGFDALKAKAAAIGANGVLLVPEPGTFDIVVTAGYHGNWYQVPMKREPKSAVGRAIFVVTE